MTVQGGNTSIPQLIAHRGWPARYPENSLAGIAAAFDAGARYVEFDVQLAGDGVPLVIHDVNLSRTAGVDLSVTETRASIIRSVTRDSSPVATLAEVCEWLAERTLTAFVEIKRQSLSAFGAAQVMDRLIPALRPALQQVVLISFAAEAVDHARRRLNVPVGWVLNGMGRSQRAKAADLEPDYLFVNHRRLRGAKLWPGKWQWAVYTVDDPDMALEMGERGVSLVETDDIGAMLASEPWREPGRAGD